MGEDGACRSALVSRRNLGRDHSLTRYALDTNILGYVEGIERVPEDAWKIAHARAILDRLQAAGRLITSTQALAELHYLLVRVHRLSPADATEAIRSWIATTLVVGVDPEAFAAAAQISAEHKLQIYDAVIIASVKDHADVLLSEDMQDGFVWNGVRVVNPFTDQSLVPTPF